MKGWAVLFRCDNRLDGKREHLMWNPGQSLMFQTRAECRAYIEEHYGYIRRRPDLRAEPHGWKMPKAVRVKVVLA